MDKDRIAAWFKNGTPIRPRIEEYEGHNVPYRGTVDHGVDLDAVEYRETEEDFPDPEMDGREVPIYEEEELPDPIPVIIVNRSSREMLRHQATMVTIDSETPTRIAGKDLNRTSCHLRNVDNPPIYIGASDQTRAYNSYKLDSGQDIQLHTQDEVWVWSEVQDAKVSLLTEYRISIND